MIPQKTHGFYPSAVGILMQLGNFPTGHKPGEMQSEIEDAGANIYVPTSYYSEREIDMVKVSVKELWEYFQTYKSDLRENCHCIAEDSANNIKVWLSCEKELPAFEVEESGHRIMYSSSDYKIQAENKYDQILQTYIDNTPGEESDEDDSLGELSEDDDERVSEIESAAEGFLSVLLEGDPFERYGLDASDVEAFITNCEGFIYDYFGYACRHPVLMPDGTTEEYPYWEDDDPITHNLT